jgi:fructose-bisphosphate aldolase class II
VEYKEGGLVVVGLELLLEVLLGVVQDVRLELNVARGVDTVDVAEGGGNGEGAASRREGLVNLPDLLLEMELGVTGGEEDGVDNTDIDSSRLYTQPEEVWEVYKALSATGGAFTIAAAFGNVHGVYAPGNVELKPDILHNTQKYLKEQLKSDDDKPAFFVFHGGSGSSVDDIRYAIKAGTIKMNIDTDTQWAFWDGIRTYEAKYHDYLQGQIGNPESETKPNKKYYDPRMSLRAGEESMAARLVKAMEDLNCIDRL